MEGLKRRRSVLRVVSVFLAFALASCSDSETSVPPISASSIPMGQEELYEFVETHAKPERLNNLSYSSGFTFAVVDFCFEENRYVERMVPDNALSEDDEYIDGYVSGRRATMQNLTPDELLADKVCHAAGVLTGDIEFA